MELNSSFSIERELKTAKRLLTFCILKKGCILFLVLFGLLQTTIRAQQTHAFSDEVKEYDGVSFLPYRKGNVLDNISGGENTHVHKIFSILASWQGFNPPQGFDLTAQGDDKYVQLTLEPYYVEDGEVITNGGPGLTIFHNDISKIFSMPVVSDIYFKPEKVADFMGYPVYYNGQFETTMIGHKEEVPFVVVSKEEFLNALIASEANKKSEGDGYVTKDEILQEMAKAYQLLLEADKNAAAEFKKEMEAYKADLDENSVDTDILTSLQNELNSLSPVERKKPAYYSLGAMEKYGNFSGLVPDSDNAYAEALVRPNYSLADVKNTVLQLLIIRWDIQSLRQNNSIPRFYTPQPVVGITTPDDILFELYQNEAIWQKVFHLVK